MKQSQFAFFCLFFSLIGMGSAQAKINIQITQGVARGIPIAIVSEQPKFEELAQVIRNDLTLCGRFDVLSNRQDSSLENVVMGKVHANAGGTYTVEFQLVDIYKARSEQASHSLLFKSFESIPSAQFRSLAHHISDLIYEKLTGVRGAFSTKIAYIRVQSLADLAHKNYYLEVADADGHNPVPLVKSKAPLMSPAWSPDGRTLAFVSFEKSRSEIYLLDVASGRRELLTEFKGINGAPTWSPNGRTLALVLSKDGNPKIYLLDRQTRELTQLTYGLSIDTEPTWSRDGRFLYFTSNRGGRPQIYRMALTTRHIERVTFRGDYNACPALTPDGKHLVMMHRSPDNHLFHIAQQDLRSGQVLTLTQGRLDESPSLSPNGAMVLYGAQVGDRQRLGLVTLEGQTQWLPQREGIMKEPAWSPFLS